MAAGKDPLVDFQLRIQQDWLYSAIAEKATHLTRLHMKTPDGGAMVKMVVEKSYFHYENPVLW